jgi:hypothetical protein
MITDMLKAMLEAVLVLIFTGPTPQLRNGDAQVPRLQAGGSIKLSAALTHNRTNVETRQGHQALRHLSGIDAPSCVGSYTGNHLPVDTNQLTQCHMSRQCSVIFLFSRGFVN